MIFAVNYLSTTINLQKSFFYKLGDFESLCRYISQESIRYAVQNGRKFDLDGKDIRYFLEFYFIWDLLSCRQLEIIEDQMN